jgi:FixJ family two-component response regulator
MAYKDKYLAASNKPPDCQRTYKARIFSGEPGIAPMDLTTGRRAGTFGKIGMQQDQKTIAIIDDDQGIRQALQRMLSAAGLRTQTFASAEEFLAALDTCAPGCAVVDLDLGKMSGFELACHPAVVAAKLPVIFISGTADETARASAMALGCAGYLRKPFMPNDLLDAVFRALQATPQIS